MVPPVTRTRTPVMGDCSTWSMHPPVTGNNDRGKRGRGLTAQWRVVGRMEAGARFLFRSPHWIAKESALTMTGGAVILEVSNLAKSYGTLRAVDDISFTVRQGESTGLLGPN